MKTNKEIAIDIGCFFLKRCDGDYKKTASTIADLGVSNIAVSGDAVEITLCRPGLLIGKRGETVDGLSKHLGMKIKIIEEVNNWTYLMTPVEYDPLEDADLYYARWLALRNVPSPEEQESCYMDEYDWPLH